MSWLAGGWSVGWVGWLVGPVGLVGSFRIGWLAWTTSRADEPRGWLQKTPAHGHARGSFLKPASRMNLGTSARKCLCGARCAFARLLRRLLQFRAASGDPARVAGIWPPARRPRGKFQRARKRSWSCSQPLNTRHSTYCAGFVGIFVEFYERPSFARPGRHAWSCR